MKEFQEKESDGNIVIADHFLKMNFNANMFMINTFVQICGHRAIGPK